MATLEIHTCDICAHLDERIFYVKDRKPGLNYPLIHPYCRCTTVPYMEDLPDIESRWARDLETGKGKFVKVDNGPKRLTFREWKNKLQHDRLTKEYHDLIKKFGRHGFPENSQTYVKLLYNKRTGRALNAYVKARQREMVEPVVTYKDYLKAMDRLNAEVVGMTASDGQKVKSFADHIIDRIYGIRIDPKGHRREGVSIDEIKNMLKSNNIKYLKKSTKFFNDRGYIVLNNQGNLVTVVPRVKKTRKWKH